MGYYLIDWDAEYDIKESLARMTERGHSRFSSIGPEWIDASILSLAKGLRMRDTMGWEGVRRTRQNGVSASISAGGSLRFGRGNELAADLSRSPKLTSKIPYKGRICRPSDLSPPPPSRPLQTAVAAAPKHQLFRVLTLLVHPHLPTR